MYGSAVGSLAFDPSQTNANLTLSGSDLTATRTTGGGAGGNLTRATVSKASGKWYVEFVAGSNTASDNFACGLINSVVNPVATSYFVGAANSGGTNSWGYWTSGNRYNNGSPTSGYATYGPSDVVMVAWDSSAQFIWFGKNGTWQGSGNPAAGTNQSYSSVSGTLYPAASCWGASSVGSIVSPGALNYSPPSGFSAWSG